MIDLVPIKPDEIKFTQINFLGPLLVNTTMDSTSLYVDKSYELSKVGNVMQRSMVKYETSMSVSATIPQTKRLQPKERWTLPTFDNMDLNIRDFPEISKEKLFFIKEEKKQDYTPTDISLEGPISMQEVLFQPKLPKIMRWNLALNDDWDLDRFSVTIKFRVSDNGAVEAVEKLSSCGYPEIDLLGINYIKQWKFAPLSGEEREEQKWGKLKIFINKS